MDDPGGVLWGYASRAIDEYCISQEEEDAARREFSEALDEVRAKAASAARIECSRRETIWMERDYRLRTALVGLLDNMDLDSAPRNVDAARAALAEATDG